MQLDVHDEPEATSPPLLKTNDTIYTYLSKQERYSKLVRLIKWEESYLAVLNSTTANITFFAPDNKALTPPRKKPRHGDSTSLSLSRAYEEYERLVVLRANDEGDDDDEEKKKRLKKLIHAVLEYHTLPTDLDRPSLYKQATYETALQAKGGSYDAQPRRIAITNDLIGRLFVNFYVTVEWVAVDAANGYIYGINRPLFPPPSILDELFFTSALQKVDLDNALQWRYKWKSPSTKAEIEGDGPVVSLFAPNNWAFKRLPRRLRLFLFSPAGEKALKKLLQFHIVPDFILHSDWVHNATKDDELMLAKRRLSVALGESDADTLAQSCSDDFSLHEFSIRLDGRMTRKMGRRIRKMLKALQGKAGKEHEQYAQGVCSKFVGTWPPHHRPPKITVNITVPTLLEDHPLRFVVAKPDTEKGEDLFDPPMRPIIEKVAEKGEIDTSDQFMAQPLQGPHALPPLTRGFVFANGVRTLVEGVARNGAVYPIAQVLHPFKHHREGDHGEDTDHWDDWEDWLPAWGDA
ncbi:hypothetical protein FRC17_003480 [Serendipita sp. 399]|nr:hypothetical protein FRC17_003480 [Serendipita sp. 399]